jgi:hypothetical protein
MIVYTLPGVVPQPHEISHNTVLCVHVLDACHFRRLEYWTYETLESFDTLLQTHTSRPVWSFAGFVDIPIPHKFDKFRNPWTRKLATMLSSHIATSSQAHEIIESYCALKLMWQDPSLTHPKVRMACVQTLSFLDLQDQIDQQGFDTNKNMLKCCCYV